MAQDWLVDEQAEQMIQDESGESHLELMRKLHEWGDLRDKLDSLEAEIVQDVLRMGATVQLGKVKAQYTKPTTVRDYEGAVRARVDELVAAGDDPIALRALSKITDAWDEATSMRESVAWAQVWAAADIPIDEVPVSETRPPKVSIKRVK